MDLLDNDWNDVLQEATAAFAREWAQEGKPLPTNNIPYGCNRLDRVYFDYTVGILSAMGVAIRSIRTAVTEGAPLLPASPICYDSHVQISIRDPSLIKDLKIIFTE